MDRIQEIQSEIAAVAKAMMPELGSAQVVLFGSRARGTARERSDFDVGIAGPQPVPLATVARFRERLESIRTLYHIDLVDLATVSEDFRRRALQDSQVLVG